MLRKVYINGQGHEKRIAVVENNQLVECFYYREEKEGVVGSLYIGRVTKVLKGMNAAFVDIGLKKMGYLHYSDTLQKGEDINRSVHEGQWLLVGIAKEGVDDKGPKLTQKVEITSSYGVYKPYDHFITMSKQIDNEEKRKDLKRVGKKICPKQGGIIFRSICQETPLAEVEASIYTLKETFEEMQRKIAVAKSPQLLSDDVSYVHHFFKEITPASISECVVDDFDAYQQVKTVYKDVYYDREKEDLFMKNGLTTALENSIKRVVWLKNGAYLLIDITETMTVIDVNTGKFTGKANQENTVYQTNLAAAKEIARQLRLRDIGGMIMVDFINMNKKEEREAVRRAFIQACEQDRSQVRVYDFTALGILEVTRKRKKQDLASFLSQPCSTCHGRGIVKSVETIVFELERELLSYQNSGEEAVLIACSPDIKKGVEEIITKEKIERACSMFLFFDVQSSPTSFYRISRFGTARDFQ
ncbi:MAG: Rne/Rng family ribonuclease [Bacillaceae bacterium]